MHKLSFEEKFEDAEVEFNRAVSRFKELTEVRISPGQELIAQATLADAQANYMKALVEREKFKLKNGKEKKKKKRKKR